MAGKIQKLSIAKPIKMVHGSGGMVLASETVEIPMGYVPAGKQLVNLVILKAL